MIGDGADFVLGIDPSPLFMKQFEAISHFMEPEAVLLLPLKLKHLDNDEIFDVVFSMGVLYHQNLIWIIWKNSINLPSLEVN